MNAETQELPHFQFLRRLCAFLHHFSTYGFSPANLWESGLSKRDAILFHFPTKGRSYSVPDAPNAKLCTVRTLRSLQSRNRDIRPTGLSELLDVLLQQERIPFCFLP
jgi:hypothetical protein